MKIELLNIDSIEKAKENILSVGVDNISVNIMDKKAVNLAFKVYDCKFYHANILKQESLAVGMDTAIEKGSITAKTKISDCLIFGDIKRFLMLSAKLKKQSFRFLRELGNNLEQYIANILNENLIFRYGNNVVNLTNNFLIMGILNVTPDSFSDGGMYNTIDKALKRCDELIEEGADIIDVGGESTRPGSEPIGIETEMKRVVPVVREIKKRFNIVVSVDTYKAHIAEAVLDYGADIINDISGMNFDKNMVSVLSKAKCGIVAMHIKGEPKNMQKNPQYEHLIYEINEYFDKILEKAENNGIERDRIVLDPGIGFGKIFEDNYKILNNIKSFKIFGRPILIGLSKKSFIGYTLNEQETKNRLFGSIGANITAFIKGANIFRVHDVKEHLEALKLARSIIKEKKIN